MQRNRMRRTTTLVAGALLIVGLVGAPALADHDHGMVVGNGDCVLLAGNGAEKHVDLPDAGIDSNPNVRGDWSGNPDRNHPLHVFVHMGQPGADDSIHVYAPGDDGCDDYRNVR